MRNRNVVKVVIGIAVILGLSASAQAAIFSDNFNDEDISDWTITDANTPSDPDVWPEEQRGVIYMKMADIGAATHDLGQTIPASLDWAVEYDLGWKHGGGSESVNGSAALVNGNGDLVSFTVYAGQCNWKYKLDSDDGQLAQVGGGPNEPDFVNSDPILMPRKLSWDADTNTLTGSIDENKDGIWEDKISTTIADLEDFSIIKLSVGSGSAKRVFDNVTVVPEPFTLSLLALGGIGFLINRRK